VSITWTRQPDRIGEREQRGSFRAGHGPMMIRESIEDGVAVITLDAPEVRNAWSPEMERQFFRVLGEADRNRDVRVVVVTGAGKTFCPGMSASVLDAPGPRAAGGAERPSMMLPTASSKPVIAAINGACAGIGLVLALNCDLRFAAISAKITTSFAQRGLPAEHGIAWTLPRIIGTSRSLDLLLSGRVVTGGDAQQMGLVDRAVDGERLMDEVNAYARLLAERCSPAAMRSIKRQVYTAWEQGPELARQDSIDRQRRAKAHQDFSEGMASFVDRRTPNFLPLDSI